jgi:hypothetical protein
MRGGRTKDMAAHNERITRAFRAHMQRTSRPLITHFHSLAAECLCATLAPDALHGATV